MSFPTPSIEEMLQIGLNCGLSTVEEAYTNYLNHYDFFFFIPKLKEQSDKFTNELKAASLTRVFKDQVSGKDFLQIADESIADAANRLNIPLFK